MLDSHLKREDITEIAFLLYAVIKKVISLLPKEVSCDFIDKLSVNSEFTIATAIQSHLQGILKMPSDSEEVHVVENQV